MFFFRKRKIEPELLDDLPPSEARPNLADLVRLNRHFGGHSTLRSLFERAELPPRERFTVLDVGAASGDSAALLRQLFPQAVVISLDQNWTNLEVAPEPKLVADAFALPFAPNSFDYVMCSLFLHHFRDEAIADLLRSFYGLAKRGVLISDLERHILPFLFLRSSRRVFGWNYVTVHDGLISVRAALRPKELRILALCAGLRNLQVRAHRPAFRISLLALK